MLRVYGGRNRPIFPACCSVNHRFPSGPRTIPLGFAGTENSVTVPLLSMRPRADAADSVNQMLESEPTVSVAGLAGDVGMTNSVTVPAVVIRPILSSDSVNQRAPSAPAMMLPWVRARCRKGEFSHGS